MKLLTPNDIATLTGLPYAKALALIKELAHIQIDNRYYISETNFRRFMTQDEAVEVRTTEN